MDSIVIFLTELKKSVWNYQLPMEQRSYNGTTFAESERTYNYVVDGLYNSAVAELLTANSEQRYVIHSFLGEVEEAQRFFEVPTDDEIKLLEHDYNETSNRSLKEDFQYLSFVKKCMLIQQDYYKRFKEKFALHVFESSKPMITESDKTTLYQSKFDVSSEQHIIHDQDDTLSENGVIKGMKGMADYLQVGLTSMQKILNSGILQKKGVVYRGPRTWYMRKDKIEKLLEEEPEVLYQRNKKR